MGAQYQFICNNEKCDHTLTTSGPWEFYRDAEGKMKDYGHPVPFSDDAAESGVQGFYADMFCADCGNKVGEIKILTVFDPIRLAGHIYECAKIS